MHPSAIADLDCLYCPFPGFEVKQLYLLSVLTTGLALAAVDRGNPQVGRAGVKENLEGLGRSSNGDHTIVGQLEGTHSKS